MIKFFAIASLLSFLGLEGCAGASSTILSIKEKVKTVSAASVNATIEGARNYCELVPAESRARFRAMTDISGAGPVITIHCERFYAPVSGGVTE